MSEIGARVAAAADSVEGVQERLIIEDETGTQYRVLSVRAVGTRTDDPGIVVRVATSRRRGW